MSSLSLSLAQLGCATIDSPSRIAVVDEVSDLLASSAARDRGHRRTSLPDWIAHNGVARQRVVRKRAAAHISDHIGSPANSGYPICCDRHPARLTGSDSR